MDYEWIAHSHLKILLCQPVQTIVPTIIFLITFNDVSYNFSPFTQSKGSNLWLLDF